MGKFLRFIGQLRITLSLVLVSTFPLLLILVTVSGRLELLAFKTWVSGCHRLVSPGWLISPPSEEYSSNVDP